MEDFRYQKKGVETQSSTSATKSSIQPPSLYRLILVLEEAMPLSEMSDLIKKYFHKSSEKSAKLATQLSHSGKGVCGVYPFDIARTKMHHVCAMAEKKQYPLHCILEVEGAPHC